jgi:hypothetical protein
MAFFGYCLQYMLKINLGIAIVCMVNNTALTMFKKDTFDSTNFNSTHYSNRESSINNHMIVNNNENQENCYLKLGQSSHLVD